MFFPSLQKLEVIIFGSFVLANLRVLKKHLIPLVSQSMSEKKYSMLQRFTGTICLSLRVNILCRRACIFERAKMFLIGNINKVHL